MPMEVLQNRMEKNDLEAGYWEWDLKGDLPFNDFALMERLGYPGSELLSQPIWRDKIATGDITAFRAKIAAHINSHAEEPFIQEVTFLLSSGKTKTYLFSGKIVQWDINGLPLLMLGSYINLTRQKEAEQQLARAKDFLTRTNDAGKIGGWEIDLASQKVEWSPGVYHIFGVPETYTPTSDNFTKFFKEDKDRDKLTTAFRQAIQNGKPYDLELKVINAQGQEIWTRTIGQPEFESGVCKRVFGIFQNIDRQKRDEVKLKMHKKQLEAFITAAPVCIAMLDRDYNYIAASEIWMASYNVDVRSIIGKNHLEVFHEISEEWKDFMARVIKGESFKREADKFIRRDGAADWLRWELKPWYEADGEVGGIIMYTELVTRRVVAEQELVKAKDDAENALQAKSRFLSVMSHEIRTPMNAVIGFSNLLLQDPRDDQKEYLNLLKFSADNLMVIINDILSLSKIEEGMVVMERADFNLKELLSNIHAINKLNITNDKLNLEFEYDERLPSSVKGDSVRLGQVITNLVSNAVKFTPEGDVIIKAKLLKETAKTINVHFEVKDSGIGIPAAKQDYIFEIFTQASSSTTRRFGGIGLGLAICRKLVMLMGGDIKVTSKEGEGATFYFTLEFKKANGDVRGNAVIGSNAANIGELEGLRLLLAEDNRINVLIVKRYLQQWGITCDVAENGKIALDMVNHNNYDLVLMDLQMPVMDGFEATKQIKSLYPELPVVAITASLVGDVITAVKNCGMHDYISKPFNPEELYQKIKRYTIHLS